MYVAMLGPDPWAINYASKRLKITLKVGVLNFQNQKKKIPKKSSSWGGRISASPLGVFK
jgi:hypothetical protein